MYVLASRRLPVLVRRAVPSSMAYGLAVFLVMQLIVLPLAGFRGGMPPPPQLWNLIAAHLFCVGLPIGLVTKRYMGGTQPEKEEIGKGKDERGHSAVR